MNPLSLIAILVLGALAYAVSLYNWLVQARIQIQASIQEIGNQLKRQAELIPNLETSAKAYLKHEKDILKMLADARKLTDQGRDATNKLNEILPRLQVVVESNPQLKGADVIQNLMAELRDTADKVMYARRSLIDQTADYNARLAVFPSNLIANTFGFKPEVGFVTPASGSHLSVNETELKTPKVNL